METIRICQQCQKLLPQNAPEGLCPECLARVALGSEPAVPGIRVPPAPAILAVQFPQLEILELLGMGGMGMVYKARQPKLDRFVALKILPIDSMPDASFAERFEREAKALAKLNHSGIVTVYDFGQTKEYYYFIMEFVDGMNLRQLMQAKTLQPRQALELVTQICIALQFAHDENIVHRDIKPENILITKKGQVKIADFGLAKLLGSQPDTALTASQMVMGTLNYMAPEQRENTKEVDHRADIYSLGVVFYEMLTGEVPMGRFEAPSKKVEVDVRLDEVVLHALEREPARRYQNVSEVKRNVETITSSMPTEMAKEKTSTSMPEAFKPEPPPGFVSSVFKSFAIVGVAWLAVGFCLHCLLGDAVMSVTLKEDVWHWSLGNWAVTFAPSAPMPIYYLLIGIGASLFYLGIAWIMLPVIFISATIAWLDAVVKCGLKRRQIPSSIRRRTWWWNGAISAGYAVVALTTAHLCLTSAHVRKVSMREFQNVSDQAAEWWFVPNSGVYDKLGFKVQFTDTEAQGPVDVLSPLPACTVSLRVHRTNAEPAVMNVILPGLRASYRFPATNNWNNTFVLDKDSLTVWFHSAGGVDLSVPKLREEADQVYELLKAHENEPPLTVKEFVNLAKADLRDFYFGGGQGSRFTFAMTDQNNGLLLVGGETLIYLALYFWSTRRLYREALAEIQAGRWTPPQKVKTPSPASLSLPRTSAPELLARGFYYSDIVLGALYILALFTTYVAGCFVPLVGLFLFLAVLLVGTRQLTSRLKILQAREKGLWPQPGEPQKFELFPKEWRVIHAGHSIRVRNSWNRGLKLFVDDVCQASTNRIFILSKSKPLLRCELVSETSPFIIEVYCYGTWEVYAKIVVNGQWIGGDNF